MTHSRDRGRDEALQAAYNANNARLGAADAATATPDPVEELLRGEATRFLRGIQGLDGPVDVRTLLGPETGMYDDAVAAREDDTDIGALGFDLGTINPLALANIREQRAARRRESAGGVLERAYAKKYQDVTGRIAPMVVAQEAQRTGNRLNTFAGTASNSLNAWANFRPRPSFMEQLLNSAASGAGQAATMAAAG